MFILSKRSLDRLNGVDPRLVAVVKRAIDVTTVDFGVTEGLRTIETQKNYVMAGKSQTMDSKHITGHAVDLVAYLGGQVSWELNLYDDIADAMKAAAIEVDVPLRWGGAWNVPDIRKWQGSMASAMLYYIDERRRENRRPFIDGPHFEISSSA
jgi:peptidoglycan L-alanyl-D-glutamate endopeptidase CwlK